MRLLVIGIDGGTREILEGMPMPFVQGLFARSAIREMNEDLLSRGWAEILTGEHASINKAFYLMPLAQQGLDFSGSYSKEDMVSNSQSGPIWRRLNSAGTRVGLVNVPTSGPADIVDGFIIAGGGGGLRADTELPKDMIYPSSLASLLQEHHYVFDIRLPGGQKTTHGFIGSITEAETNQKDAFIELSKRMFPSFGFHCFRMTTEIQYLARFEIGQVIEGIRDARTRGAEYEPQSALHQSLVEHYSRLDENIRHLFEEIQPESYLFIADHSTALLTHEGNIDVWLADSGYLKLADNTERIARAGIIRLRDRVFRPALKRFGRSYPRRVRRPITKFSKRSTVAFGTFYEFGGFAGIYINDASRFGGPVRSEVVTRRLVDEICDSLNSSRLASDVGISASPFRRTYSNAVHERLMPDIRLDKPDGIYFSGRPQAAIVENERLGTLGDDLSRARYPFTGHKGRNPMFVFNRELEALLEEDDPNDLRTANRLICRYFGIRVTA